MSNNNNNNDYHKERNPYLNAPRGRKLGYKTCRWNREDAMFVKCVALGIIGTIFILATYLTLWIIGG
jgi:hypothetical protein